ncbi:MAG: hypothetical protein KGV59_01950 [Tenacibaculum sp.]|nr:hypothetical protein [Tenacibaculum sp.]
MAEHICPRCKKTGFTWHIDEEISILTIWNCSNCNYKALENEEKERICKNCQNKTKSKLMRKTIGGARFVILLK